MPTTDRIRIDAVDVFYGSTQALFSVSLHVAPGEVVAVLGGNASGKSTTIKTALGLVRPRHGMVYLDGKPTTDLATHHIVRQGVASIPEGRRVFADMTVLENLQLGAYTRRRQGHPTARTAIDEALNLFPVLKNRLGQAAGTLSGGEQQMLAMARAWVGRPRLLCIDEPSMGLSPMYVDRIYDILHELKQQGVTMLMVEQSANRALEVADRAYILQNGRIVLHGASADLANDPAVQQAYLGEIVASQS